MALNQILTQKILKTYLRYDPILGYFIWIKQQGRSPIGTRAGTPVKTADGYISIRLFGNRYLAHRLAYFYMTGQWPPEHMDHKNLKKYDNRWTNIRLASRHQNLANTRRYKNNTSGYKGVCRNGNYWKAEIRSNGKTKFLGNFASPRKAHIAYKNAAQTLRGEFARV